MASGSKSSVNKGKAPLAVNFIDVSLGLSASQLRFRLIHFWEAKNIAKGGFFLGLELLMIDAQGTVIQGFISSSRAETYRRHLIGGAIYTLQNFFVVPKKLMYRVANHTCTITFTNGSVLSLLNAGEESRSYPADSFRFHTHSEFQANCGLRNDLYDVVGHLRLVDGQALNQRPVLDESEINKARHIVVHIQIKDAPILKMYLWDAASKDFYKKFTSSAETPSVFLVTTVNPKNMSGTTTMSLSSMASSRVFLDKEVQPTIEYMNWLGLNPEVAQKVDAEEVTKTEVMTIGQIMAYLKKEDAKVASFLCVATVDDVVRDRPWYYIACSDCHTKATKGPSTLMCAKCGKDNVSGVPMFLAKINVYDNNDQAVFVLLGDAGKELTGKTAAQLVDIYFEANEAVGDDQHVPVPQDLLDTIGKTHRFKIKISDLNLTGKVQAFTVTKVVSPDSLPPLSTPIEVLSTEEDGVPLPTASVVTTSQVEGDENGGIVGEVPGAKRPRHAK